MSCGARERNFCQEPSHFNKDFFEDCFPDLFYEIGHEIPDEIDYEISPKKRYEGNHSRKQSDRQNYTCCQLPRFFINKG